MAVAGTRFKVTLACLPDYTPISISPAPDPAEPLSHGRAQLLTTPGRLSIVAKGQAFLFFFLIHLKSCRAGLMKESQGFNLGIFIVGVC